MAFAFKMDLAGTMKDVLGVLNKQLVSFDTGLGKVTASIGSFEKSFAVVEGVKALGAAAQWAIGHIVELGKSLVGIVAKTQDLNLAARLQLGEGGAAMLQKVADSFGNTRFDDDAIKHALLPLATAGIKDGETLDAIATAAIDISTRFNSGEAGFQAATEALGKIALKREASAKALEALGINEQDFLKTLAAQQGRTVETIKKQIADGKLSAPTLLNAALQSIADKQGGALGVAALEGGKTLGGTLQRLSNLPDNLFKQLADSPAIAKVQQSIEGIIDALAGERGSQLVAQLGSMLERVFNVITPERVLATFGFLLDTVEAIGQGVMLMAKAFDVAGTALGETAAKIYLFAVNLGESIATGISEGIKSAIDGVKNAVTSVGEGAVSTLKDILGIHSPSRVFMELGSRTSEGFALGMTRSISDVEDAQRAMSAAAVPSAQFTTGPQRAANSMFGAAASGGISIGDIYVTTAATDAEGTALAVRRELVAVFTDFTAEAA